MTWFEKVAAIQGKTLEERLILETKWIKEDKARMKKLNNHSNCDCYISTSGLSRLICSRNCTYGNNIKFNIGE